jgi:hypothetical protein
MASRANASADPATGTCLLARANCYALVWRTSPATIRDLTVEETVALPIKLLVRIMEDPAGYDPVAAGLKGQSLSIRVYARGPKLDPAF